LDAIEQYVSYVLAEVVGVALDIRQQRVKIDQRRRLYLVESREILAFEHVDQQQHIRIDVDVRLLALAIMLVVRARAHREVGCVVQHRALVDLI